MKSIKTKEINKTPRMSAYLKASQMRVYFKDRKGSPVFNHLNVSNQMTQEHLFPGLC